MSKKAAGVTTPISSRELELICKARHIAGKLEGLREAAEILSGYLKAGNTAGLQTGLLQDSLDDILARIAELEKP